MSHRTRSGLISSADKPANPALDRRNVETVARQNFNQKLAGVRVIFNAEEVRLRHEFRPLAGFRSAG